MEIFRHNNPLGYRLEVTHWEPRLILNPNGNNKNLVWETKDRIVECEGVMMPYDAAKKRRQEIVRGLKANGVKEKFKINIVPEKI